MVKKITTLSYLEPLLYSEEFMHLAEISKKLKKNHTSVRKHLNHWEKEGILLKQKKGKLTTYKIKKNHPLIIDYLTIIEKEKKIKNCEKNLLINEINELLLKNLNENNKAIIFGSAIENINKANDIDIIISGKTKIEEKLQDFEKKFNKKIHLIKTPNLKKINETLKKEIIKKHIIIQGSEQIIKWLI
jgi:hypothetical protein